MKKSIATLMVASCVGIGGVYAQVHDENLTVTVNGDFASAHISKGTTANDGTVFQPSLNLGRRVGDSVIGFSIWGNYNFTDYSQHGMPIYSKNQFSEIDLSIYWAMSVENFDLKAGYIYKAYPYQKAYRRYGGSPTTDHVFFFDAATTLEDKFTFGIRPEVSNDTDDSRDEWACYLLAYINYAIEAADKLTITPHFEMGLADRRQAEGLGGNHGGFANYELRMSADYKIRDNLRLHGRVGYVNTWDTDVIPREAFGIDVKFYGLLGVSCDL
jgi:hypothetical protein